MGILNVTPDSFSDGGRYLSTEHAIDRAMLMIEHGADIIDIGGESTRPGAQRVSIDEELQRTIPVIQAIRARSDVIISIDTSKAIVMREAVQAGASMINDVMALIGDDSLHTAVELDVPVCLMHMQGEPGTMQQSPDYPQGVVNEIKQYLVDRLNLAVEAGISKDKLIIDPGFGFGKTLQHNYELLANLAEFRELGCRLLVGLSRKSMIGNLLKVELGDRLTGSLAAAVIATMQGADILRVHDVRETVQAILVLQATRDAANGLPVDS
jgi:dihydropteroate synthase